MEKPLESDQILLEQIAAGDSDALGRLAGRYQDMALSVAYRTMQNWADAEDIVQEAFIRVFRSAGRYKGHSSFKTWLYRIIVNLCMDYQRKNKPAVSLDAVEIDPSGQNDPDRLGEQEIAAIVQKAVSELPERQRITLVLHRYENLTHSEIAEATGWSRSAIESLLVRAYESLRNKLEGLKNN